MPRNLLLVAVAGFIAVSFVSIPCSLCYSMKNIQRGVEDPLSRFTRR